MAKNEAIELDSIITNLKSIINGDVMLCAVDNIEMYRRILPKMELLAKYEAIGTVEECWEAKDKQSSKKVKNRKFLRDFYNRPYSVRGDCPNCGSIGLLSTNTDYCNVCGQKLDWSEIGAEI